MIYRPLYEAMNPSTYMFVNKQRRNDTVVPFKMLSPCVIIVNIVKYSMHHSTVYTTIIIIIMITSIIIIIHDIDKSVYRDASAQSRREQMSSGWRR